MTFHNTPRIANMVLLNISDINQQKLQTESHHTIPFKTLP